MAGRRYAARQRLEAHRHQQRMLSLNDAYGLGVLDGILDSTDKAGRLQARTDAPVRARQSEYWLGFFHGRELR